MPLYLAAIILVFAVGAALSVRSTANLKAQISFDAAADEAVDRINTRISLYIGALMGIKGLMVAQGYDSEAHFNRFVEELDLQQYYPGIQGLGFCLRIDAAARQSFVEEQWAHGRPDFHIWPETPPRDEYHAILFLYPPDARNRAAIGFDMHSEVQRRAAMDHARDTGEATASGRLTLVQEIYEKKQPGFLIFLPIYRDAPTTVEERRAQLIGFAYSPFRADDLLRGVFGAEHGHQLDMVIYAGDDATPGNLLHRSDVFGTPLPAGYVPRFSGVRRTVIAGQPWLIEFKSRPSFERALPPDLSVAILAAGALIAMLAYVLLRLRSRVEVAELESEQNFRRMANSALVLIWMTDADGRLKWVNSPWSQFTGYAINELVAGKLVESIHPDDREDVMHAFERAAPGREGFTTEFRVRRDDGRYAWFLNRGAPLFHHRGAFEGYIGSCVDITAMKQLQRDLDEHLSRERELRHEAEVSSQMKDDFLATLGHELRTPLNAILGWVQLMRRRGMRGSEIEEGLAVIERNARDQASMVDDLLDMNRITSGRMRLEIQDVRIGDLVRDALEAVRPAAAAKGILLEQYIDESIGMLRADSTRVRQVLWNLLSNAVKFTKEGGKVVVRVERREGGVHLSVRDTGQGIEPDFLPFIFEKFRQGDPSITRAKGGLGLGLAIVKHLVELHGGTVRAESEGLGKGAVFSIYLPRVAPVADATTKHQAFEKDPVHTPDRDVLDGVEVLLVEDEPDARTFLAALIEDHGAAVKAAGSASEALDILSWYRPALIISDIAMPNEDGYSFLRKVRASGEQDVRATPAIALTALAQEEDRKRALEAGYQVYLRKPVEPFVLIAEAARLAQAVSSGDSSA